MRLHAALLSLLLTFSCSPRPTVLPAPAAPIPSDPTAPGMVWRVSNPENKTFFYLAGSFHLLRASDYPLPSPYETAWAASTHLLLEIPPGDASSPETKAALAPLLSLPPGEKLQDHLPPEIWTRLTAWSQQNNLSLNNFQSQPPWLAALTVTVTTAKALGFDSSYGIEQHLAARLPGSGKTAEGLETAIGQMSLLKNLPPAVHQAMLQQALLDVDLLPEKAATLTKAWRQGDTETLHNIFTLSFKDFPDLQKALLADRNTAWLPRLESLLKYPSPVQPSEAAGNAAAPPQPAGPTLVLVGAAHLCGPEGLLALLRSKGYITEHLLPTAPAAAPTPEPSPSSKSDPTPLPSPSPAPGQTPPPLPKAA